MLKHTESRRSPYHSSDKESKGDMQGRNVVQIFGRGQLGQWFHTGSFKNWIW